MAVSEDLINFDLIETHKENIQSLPGGRSARQLASILSPQGFAGKGTKNASPTPQPTLDETKTLNDAIRAEYELELSSLAESDDPLDIYDRYVKWTLNAYPSAQATPQSQLLPLLEKATKAFLSSPTYKNDPRYLKLWLHYIRLFSDAPRETFAFLARHGVGDALALFYEEFAAWLEGAGRWTQAEEVYGRGIEREARPTERLARRYAQFRKRFEARRLQNADGDGDGPSSPALPTVRPALAAKIDPFAPSSTTTPRSDELSSSLPHRPASGAGAGGAPSGTSRSGKPKMAIFSDANNSNNNDTPPPQPTTAGTDTKGWDSIGSLQERKKENAIAARPWAGETLKAGKMVRAGTTSSEPKMTIFRDTVCSSYPSALPAPPPPPLPLP